MLYQLKNNLHILSALARVNHPSFYINLQHYIAQYPVLKTARGLPVPSTPTQLLWEAAVTA